jgi:hypothetical protein
MADVPERVMHEKLRAKEEEVRRRERDVKQREQQIRDRQDELETAKASCDALMVELHGREGQVAEVEKKHGTLKRREDEVSTREIVLADKDAAQHKRLQMLSQAEQRLAQDRSAHRLTVAAHEQRLEQWESRLVARAAEVETGEARAAAAKQAHQKRQAADEDALARREKAASDHEAKLNHSARSQELKALETEHMNEQASERLRAIKADQVDLESRLREVRWKDDTLTDMLEAANAQKKKLTSWERELAARESATEARDAELGEQREDLAEQAAELALRTERILCAERDVAERLERCEALAVDNAARVSKCEAEEASLRSREVRVVHAEEAIAARADELQREVDEVAARKAAVRSTEHTVREKERALKTWLLELEFRQRGIERREQHPRPYLAPAEPEAAERVLQLGATSNAAHDGGSFNRALVSLEVEQLQRAYLGASRTAKASAATHTDRVSASSSSAFGSSRPGTSAGRGGSVKGRVNQSPTPQGDRSPPAAASTAGAVATAASPSQPALRPDVEDQAVDTSIADEMAVLEREFRDLSCGFAVMPDDERDALFTEAEVDEVVAVIEADCRAFDEHRFLRALAAKEMPRVSVTSSPQDSLFVAAVERWVAERTDTVRERLRRSSLHRVRILERGVALLQGRVAPHPVRVRALTAGGLPPAGRGSRTPAVMTNAKPVAKRGGAKKLGARPSPSRPSTPAVAATESASPEDRSPRPGVADDSLDLDWGSASPSPTNAESPLVGSISRSSRKPQRQAPSNAAGAGSKVRARLVEALPEELRVYYIGL